PPIEVVQGIGDDCAVLALSPERYLLWTIDSLIEGVHFDLGYTTLRQLGRKALAVNLSDIAAMGGEPQYALLSLGWPPKRELSGALEVAAGLQEIAKQYGVSIIGGDTVQSPIGLTLSLTVIGSVNPGELLCRHGAQVGDLIYVTGPLGEAAAGLEVLRRGTALPAETQAVLLRAFLDPTPQLRAARVLAQHHLATALIDLSDGVATDLYHICCRSRVGARLQADRILISTAVRQAAEILTLDPLNLALKGGEDYQLLFTSPARQESQLQRCFQAAALPLPWTIGRIIAGERVYLETPQGEEDISGAGFDHFAPSALTE
ncbi:MAG: thiamine-phosphate kinase, partial [Deltaproteobacteria bacterium]|nr:thiamine-phosphate kinase [Deltaproteobacteria bacterium]